MITNTELDRRGNIFPNRIVDFKQDNDQLYFTTENGVILEMTDFDMLPNMCLNLIFPMPLAKK